jgi:hypothetical protein
MFEEESESIQEEFKMLEERSEDIDARRSTRINVSTCSSNAFNFPSTESNSLCSFFSDIFDPTI